MARSVWKGPFVDAYVLRKAEKARKNLEKKASKAAKKAERPAKPAKGRPVRQGVPAGVDPSRARMNRSALRGR